MLAVVNHFVDNNIICFSATARAYTCAWCTQQFKSCCTKLSTSFFLSYIAPS